MRLRRKMSMLFQFGALFTDMTVFDNVAFQLREHTELPEDMIRDLVLMKLNAVGLRGAANMFPSSSRAAWRARGLARAGARPHAHHVRRTFRRPGSDFARRGQGRPSANSTTPWALHPSWSRTTYWNRCRSSITCTLFPMGALLATAPDEIRASDEPFIKQFVHAELDGPVPFHYPAPRMPMILASPPGKTMMDVIAKLGSNARAAIMRAGTRAILVRGAAAPKASLTPSASDAARGLFFRGDVAGDHHGLRHVCRGWYWACKDSRHCKYGAQEQMGVLYGLVAGTRTRAGGFRVAVCQPRRSAITAEIGLMKTTEQLKAMDMMAIDPIARVVAPRFWAGIISMPLLAALFSMAGIMRRVVVAKILVASTQACSGATCRRRSIPIRHP